MSTKRNIPVVSLGGEERTTTIHSSGTFESRVKKRVGEIVNPKELEKYVKHIIHLMILSGKNKFNSSPNIEVFEELVSSFEKILKTYNLTQIYRLSDKDEIEKYSQLSLEEMFLNNIQLKNKGHSALEASKGGSCINWCIFFYKLFGEIFGSAADISFIKAASNNAHVGTIIRFEDETWMVDPHKKPMICKLEVGKEIPGWPFPGEITSTFPVKITNDPGTQEFEYSELQNNIVFYGINIKTFEGEKKRSLLIIKNIQTHNNILFEFSPDNSSELIRMLINPEELIYVLDEFESYQGSYDILYYLFSFKKIFSKDESNGLQYICEKLSKEDLIKYLRNCCEIKS